jgi:hypothetical protein
VRAGCRQLKDGTRRQLYRCNECWRRYSTKTRTGKHTDPAAILRALTLVCQGVAYDDVLTVLWREFAVKRSRSAISRWVAEFPLPWLTVQRHGETHHGLTATEHLFTHAGLRYRYRVHRPKLRFAQRQFPHLVQYLTQLPRFLDHDLFDRAVHASSLQSMANPGVRGSRDTQLTRLAGSALQLAASHYDRHPTIETYFLFGDRNTIATEVPVYYFDKQLGTVAGHIDLLQVWGDRLLLLDYKPRAAKEIPGKVISQLHAYAIALSLRARIPLRKMQCVWFDEKDAFYFNPARVRPSTTPPPDSADNSPLLH